MKYNLKYGLAALVGMGLSANVAAVDYGCDDITFTPEAYEAYEFVDQACTEIVEREQGIFAKLTAQVASQTTTGHTRIRFRHADGELGPTSTVGKADFLIGEDGQKIDLANVQARSDFRVYLSMNYWSPPAPLVEEVAEAAPPPPVEEVAEAAPPPPPPPPPPAPEPEPEPEMLPTTASNLPWLALFGALFLVLGGALRFSRR